MFRLDEESPFNSVASTSQEGQEEKPCLSHDGRLRVTLLSSEWKSTEGGLSTINRELAIQLAKHPNVEVSVYLPQCSEEDRKVASDQNIQLIEAEELPGFEPIDWLSSLPKDHLPHCVIGHGVHLGRQVPLIKRRHDCKWIQVVHTAPEELGMFKSYEEAICKGEQKHQAEVKLCETADQVVAVGPKLKDAYSRYLRFSGKDQDVINLTPDIFSEFYSIKQASEERSKFSILVFGRGDDEDFKLKGYDIAARTVAELKDTSYQLIFVGAPAGKEADVAERLLQHGIPATQLTVRRFNESREQLARLFCEVDLAIMPSRTEGFGLTALEALSAGLPVLVSGNSGLGDALKKVPSGYSHVIDSESPLEWAKAIRIVRQKGREVRLEEAKFLREKYALKYSWYKQCDFLVEKMLNLTSGSFGTWQSSAVNISPSLSPSVCPGPEEPTGVASYQEGFSCAEHPSTVESNNPSLPHIPFQSLEDPMDMGAHQKGSQKDREGSTEKGGRWFSVADLSGTPSYRHLKGSGHRPFRKLLRDEYNRRSLIENHFLKTESVRLFILDEADKLLEDSFQEQINWIFSSLPSNKQMMAFSATYPEYLAKHLTRYMREPTFVRLNATDPTLQGIKQFYKLVPFHPLPHKTFQEKVSELLKLLSSLPFHQCLVFSNYQIRAQSLCDTLHLKGWPSVFIAGSQTQTQRLKAMERLKQFKCRVLISTDLTSRGIDAENVNVVVNMDVPRDSETYLHRIGRAGRFGTQGVAVTFVAKGEEEKLFKRIEETIGTTIDVLPDPIPQSLGTSGSPNELDSKPVQSRATAVEIDILKGDSTQELDDLMDKNNSHENEIQHSTRNCDDTVDAANETVCVEDGGSDDGDLREQESLKTDAEFMINKGSLQNLETESDKRVCVNTETEDVVANIGERLQRCLHINQNCEKKSISEKQVDRRNCEITVSQPQTSAAENLQDTCEVSSSNDLKDSESKTDHKPSFKFAAFENSSVSLEESLSILQVGSHSDSRHSCIKKTTNDPVNEGIGVRHNTLPSKKGKTADQKLFKCTLADEANSSESQSENERTSDSDGESEDSSGGLNLDEHDNTDRASSIGDSLPPVEEFNRDFEEYLQNVSNDLPVLGNSVENLSHSSELSDDTDDDGIHSEDALYCINVKDDDYDRTPSEAYVATQYCNTLPDTYYRTPHQDSNIGYFNGQHINAQNQTDNSTSGTDHQENILSERSWNYHEYPHTSFWDGYNWLNNNNYYNYYSDQGYNNFPSYHGNYATNWQAYAQGQGDTAIAQQYVGQYYGDTASYQEYQWNASWYNAYHRQTSRIMQFVSFSRSARL